MWFNWSICDALVLGIYYRRNRKQSVQHDYLKMRHLIVSHDCKTVVRIALIVANNIDNLCMHVYGEVHSNVLVLLLLAVDILL